MSEETDFDTGLMGMEDEQMSEEREDKGNQEKSSPMEKQAMTGKESIRGSMPDREVGKEGSEFSELGNSLLGSFQSLHSSQGSERDKMIPYVPPCEEVKVLQSEDTLSKEDHRNFSLIYESLLLEGKAGNLTDLMMGMVLSEKPLAWLQVMHGRLKHLIISSETFQKKKKAEYDAQARAKQTGKEKGMGKHSKGIRYLGDSGKGKGKGKWPHRKSTKTKIALLNVRRTSRSNQSPGSITGIQRIVSFLFDLIACIGFYVPLLLRSELIDMIQVVSV